MDLIKSIKPQILDELNIEDLEFIDDMSKLDPQKYVFVSEGGCSFAVPKKEEIPERLLAEGMAREIVRRLQTMRRSAGFDIADHIITYYQGDDYIRQVMTDKNLADYIKQETLSRQLIDGVPGEGVFTERHKLSGYDVLLGVKRLT